MPGEHRIEYVESRPDSVRWKCSCGDGSGGRWYRSYEEAHKAATRHLERHQER